MEPHRPSTSESRTGPGPLAWILGLTGLCTVGIGLGGFVLPKSLDFAGSARAATIAPEPPRPPVVAPPPVQVAVAPVVDTPAPEPRSVKPARKLPPLLNPTTAPVLPEGRAYDLARKIDGHIDAGLTSEKISPSPLASDAEYLRRAYLDLTGRVPAYEKVKSFLEDTDPQKRPKLIDELLASDAFGRHFAEIWTDTLIKRDTDTNRNLKTDDFTTWMAKQFNENRAWDKIVVDLVTASGKVDDNPQTLFVLANQDNNQVSPSKLVGATANLFLGLQLQCAECHVHPHVEAWKQDDFWSMAAFFGHTKFEREGMKPGRAPVTEIKEVARTAQPKGKAARQGEKAIPPGDTIAIPDPTDAKKTIGTAKARLFESTKPANLGNAVPYRPKLATWLTSTDNKYFARAAVNRFWGHFFARGIINPVEDMGPNSEPTHPELLDLLAREFAKSQFDLKELFRAYCNTAAYNRTSKPTESNASDVTLLSHMPVKVIGARELIDSLRLVAAARSAPLNRTEMRELQKEMAKNKGLNAPAAGLRFFDKREYEDDTTGYSYGIPQLLKQMNTAMTNSGGTVARFAKPGRERSAVIIDLYMTALGRQPRPEELERLLAYSERKSDKAYQDIFWALLNSAEFVSNH